MWSQLADLMTQLLTATATLYFCVYYIGIEDFCHIAQPKSEEPIRWRVLSPPMFNKHIDRELTSLDPPFFKKIK